MKGKMPGKHKMPGGHMMTDSAMKNMMKAESPTHKPPKAKPKKKGK